MIYLDYNATTPVDKSVAEAMLPFIYQHFGNPSSNHSLGIKARTGVEDARKQVAQLLGSKPDEIVFTGGGSESNNAVIKGVAHSFRSRGDHIVTSQIEHPAVLNPCKFLEGIGYKVTCVPVDGFGIVNPTDVEKAITPKTILVSIMHANNETGSIQPISEISKICRERGVLFHIDAAQSVGKIPVQVNELGVDFLTIAGHKLYAPKGVGALYIRNGISIESLIHGASQEQGRRAGTENVIFAVALGRACEIAGQRLGKFEIQELTKDFYEKLVSIFGGRVRLNGHPALRLPNTLFLSFLGFSVHDVQKVLQGVAFSMGSACHSGSTTLSPVLKAMGVDESEPMTTIRFSLGRHTTAEEINLVVERLAKLSKSK